MKDSAIIEINSLEELNKQLESNGVSCVYFWASWCGPCLEFAPLFQEIAHQNSNIHFYKVNIDSSADLAIEYKVKSIPTILLFNNSKMIKTQIGRMTKQEFENFLQI